MHRLGLIHCDLKPENIMIADFGEPRVKLIDLGSSCFARDRLTTYVQSRSYRAPEVVLRAKYDYKIDVWSLGCILAELLSGAVLFQVRGHRGTARTTVAPRGAVRRASCVSGPQRVATCMKGRGAVATTDGHAWIALTLVCAHVLGCADVQGGCAQLVRVRAPARRTCGSLRRVAVRMGPLYRD